MSFMLIKVFYIKIHVRQLFTKYKGKERTSLKKESAIMIIRKSLINTWRANNIFKWHIFILLYATQYTLTTRVNIHYTYCHLKT